ncbi:MAG: 1-deoxy-D-xylulose-5-phosphate synthase [Planctomycetota bacterium]
MAGKKTRIMYVECKSSNSDPGRARICRVSFSNSGRTIYYGGLKLQRSTQTVCGGNVVDISSGQEYWVSGPKKNGHDRHWAVGGVVRVDSDVVDKYWRDIRGRRVPDDPFTT